MNSRTTLIAVLAVATILRIVLVFCEEISPTEAYYYLCSEKPAAAYFDGPAGTAKVVGWINALGIGDLGWRLTAPLWALAATLACYALGARLADAKTATWAALALNTIPVFNAASIRVGPLLPALTFLLLAFLAIWSAYRAERGTFGRWVAAGLCAAFAIFFSYTVAPFVIAAALFVFCSDRHRGATEIAGASVAIMVMLLAFAPAVEWNAGQDWIPMAGGTLRTIWEFKTWEAFWAAGHLVEAISSLLLVGMLFAWWISGRESRSHSRPRFVFVVALPAVVFSLYLTLRGKDAITMFLFAAPLLLLQWPKISSSPRVRILFLIGMAIGLIGSSFSVATAFSEGSGWSKFAIEVAQVRNEQGPDDPQGLFLIAQDAPLASMLGYRLHDSLTPPAGHPPVYVRESPDISDQFALWPNYGDFVDSPETGDEYFTEQKGENPFVGRSALYITREAPEDLPQTVKAAFRSCNPLGRISRTDKDALYIYLCLNYETLPL